MPDQPAPLSDTSLELLLKQTPWGRGGVARLIKGAPDLNKLWAFWSGLTVYRLVGTYFQHRYDKAPLATQGRTSGSLTSGR